MQQIEILPIYYVASDQNRYRLFESAGSEPQGMRPICREELMQSYSDIRASNAFGVIVREGRAEEGRMVDYAAAR